MNNPPFRKRKKGVCGKDPEDIGILLQMVLDKNHIIEDMTLKRLSEGFADVIGPLLLPHIEIVKFSKGILTLKCASSTWKHELFLQKKAIIDKCNLLLESPAVKNILFI